MKLHAHDPEGPPCRHMEGMLQATADGSSRGLIRWYAVSHAAKCDRCGRYLVRMTETVQTLRDAKDVEPTAEVLDRLASAASSLER